MTIKFLSLYPGTFIVAAKANLLSAKIPYWATNMFLFHSIAKQRPPRLAYPKKTEKEKTWPKEALQKVSQRYCCSSEHAVQILTIMEKQNPNILEALGVGKQSKYKGKKR